jgi:peptidyl-prolyl cis-trans isomerase D
MLSFLSSKFRFLLIIVLIILGVSFIFFDRSHSGSGPMDPKVAVIGGKSIKRTDFEFALRSTSLIYTLQTGRRAEPQMDRIFRAQTWNRLLVLAAAKEAGLSATTQQAVQFIKEHPLFKDEKGNYSPTNFQNFNMAILRPQGISEERFQEIIQDQIVFEQLLKTISATAVIRPSEVKEAYEALYGQVSIHYALLPESTIRASVHPTIEDLQMTYQSNQATFLSPELRQVEYVRFSLKPEQAKLPEDQKKGALRELMQQAYQFTEPFFDTNNAGQSLPDFKQMAAKAGLTVSGTGFINRQSTLINGEPDSTKLTQLAFSLRPDAPVSDFQQIPDGYIVLHLVEVQEPRAIPFEKVQKEIEQLYLTNKVNELLADQGKKLAKELQSKVAAGMSWDQAVQAQGLKSVAVPPFSPAKNSDLKDPAADAIRFWAQKLKVGAVSEFSRSKEGGLVFYLAERKLSADPNQEKAMKGLEAQLEQQRRYQILDAWISARMKQKGTNIPTDLLNGEIGQTL